MLTQETRSSMTKSMAKLEKVLKVMVSPRISPARTQWPFRKAIVGLTDPWLGRAIVDERQLIFCLSSEKPRPRKSLVEPRSTPGHMAKHPVE